MGYNFVLVRCITISVFIQTGKETSIWYDSDAQTHQQWSKNRGPFFASRPAKKSLNPSRNSFRPAVKSAPCVSAPDRPFQVPSPHLWAIRSNNGTRRGGFPRESPSFTLIYAAIGEISCRLSRFQLTIAFSLLLFFFLGWKKRCTSNVCVAAENARGQCSVCA